MSGGAYNYLCYKEADGDSDLSIWLHTDEVKRMAHRLMEIADAEDAVSETEELLLIMHQAMMRVRVRIARLHDVWHAVEWRDSMDYGDHQVQDALRRYREDVKSDGAAGVRR